MGHRFYSKSTRRAKIAKNGVYGGAWPVCRSVFLRFRLAGSNPLNDPNKRYSILHKLVSTGIREIRYLDSSSLIRHRSFADLMRYTIVNMGFHFVAHYGDFQPPPDQSEAAETERARQGCAAGIFFALYRTLSG